MFRQLWLEIKNQFTNSNSMIVKIILVNVAVFIVVNVLLQLIFFLAVRDDLFAQTIHQLALPASLDNLLDKPWTLISYMFVHADFFHILFNMLWLFWLGNILQEYIGAKKILPVYLLGALAGAWMYILAYNIFPAFKNELPFASCIGASAGVTAIVVATATLLPNYSIFLMFIGAVRLKWLAFVFVLLDLLQIPQGNAGGHIAHLGGAAFGFFYVKELQRGNDLGKPISMLFDWIAKKFTRRKKLKIKYTYTKSSAPNAEKQNRAAVDKQKRIDEILDKISKSGYEKLSAEEKEFLFHLKDEN